MTANVAQVFLTDVDWRATLRGFRRALQPAGHLVVETRDPARRAWEEWPPELTHTAVDVPGTGVVESWEEVIDVSGDLVTFRSMTALRRADVVLESRPNAAFPPSVREAEASLRQERFELVDLRDAPDRPGREVVFITRRAP